VAKKQFDPLWEIVDEKIALQDVEPDVDVPCPYCAVPLHLGAGVAKGLRVTCGLCGGGSEVVDVAGSLGLKSE
jgi:hypothetical protein